MWKLVLKLLRSKPLWIITGGFWDTKGKIPDYQVPVNETLNILFLFDPELPCLCFCTSKISDQFFICLFLSGNIQIHLSHSLSWFSGIWEAQKWRLIRSIYRPNSWNKIPTQKLCHTWNQNGGKKMKNEKMKTWRLE